MASPQQTVRRHSIARILIVAPSPGIPGGQAVQAARLTTALRGEASLDVGFLPVNPALPGVLGALQKVKYIRTIVTSLVYVGILLARVRTYDIIHVFSASYFSFLLAPAPAILIARLFGKKVLLNYRSGECEDHLRRWRMALPVVRLAHRVIVPSGYLVEVFERFGIRAEAIANIVDETRSTFRTRKPLSPVLLSNRNFERLYNIEAILRAFAMIQFYIPSARLIVAGDGTRRNSLHFLAAFLDLRNVEFVGAVEPARMHELHERADILVNSSNIDNMPSSIVEAFAAGLAVVTTDAGGIAHIVKNNRNGLMVECGDEAGLARSVLALLENQCLADRLISAAYEDSKKYTWSAVRPEWMAVYADLARAARVQPLKIRPDAQNTRNKGLFDEPHLKD